MIDVMTLTTPCTLPAGPKSFQSDYFPGIPPPDEQIPGFVDSKNGDFHFSTTE
jgi:hypothetical protein